MNIKCSFHFPGQLGSNVVDKPTLLRLSYKNIISYDELMMPLNFNLYVEMYQKLKKTFPQHHITAYDTRGLLKEHCMSCKNSTAFFIIENLDTKKYFVVSYTDKLLNIFNKDLGWDVENLVELFASGGTHLNDVTYEEIPNFKYTPFSLMTDILSAYHRIEYVYHEKKIKKIPDRLTFRGGYYGTRSLIDSLDNRIKFLPNRIGSHFFIDELNENLINLDINGAFGLSKRTIDSFGVGSALIRPVITTKFHNQLIPDYHYAAIKCGNSTNIQELIDGYIDRFEDLKKDLNFVYYLGENGRKWYEENSLLDSYLNIFIKLIDFKKLL